MFNFKIVCLTHSSTDFNNYDPEIQVEVTPTTFWLKCIDLPNCTKFCSTDKLEVSDKYFGFLQKLSHGLANKGTEGRHTRQYLGYILESLK